MNKLKSKGFTLIELLVVIAIIGLLSSVVLVSLSNARNKGRDSSAVGSLSSLRSAAEMYYSGSANYGSIWGGLDISAAGTVTNVVGGSGWAAGTAGVCSDTEVVKLMKAVQSQLPAGTGNLVHCSVGKGGLSYSVYAVLNGSATNHAWCVDDAGVSGDIIYTGAGITFVAGAVGADTKCK